MNNVIEFTEGLVNLDRVCFVRPAQNTQYGRYGLAEVEDNPSRTTFVFANECTFTVDTPYQQVMALLAKR